MRATWCLSILLLGLAVSFANGAPKVIEKKFVGDGTKSMKSSTFGMGEAGTEKDRAKKSAAFCVEIRPGTQVAQTSRNFREKKSNEAKTGQTSQVAPNVPAQQQENLLEDAQQIAQPAKQTDQTLNAAQANQQQVVNQPASIPDQQPGTCIYGKAPVGASCTSCHADTDVPKDSPMNPEISVRALDTVDISPDMGPFHPLATKVFQQKVQKCIENAILEAYQTPPKTMVPLASRNIQEALFYGKEIPTVNHNLPNTVSSARTAEAVSNVTPPEDIDNPDTVARNSPNTQLKAAAYRPTPTNGYRQSLFSLDIGRPGNGLEYPPPYPSPYSAAYPSPYPSSYPSAYPLADELYYGPSVIERVRYLRSSKDGSAEEDESAAEGEKEKKESSPKTEK